MKKLLILVVSGLLFTASSRAWDNYNNSGYFYRYEFVGFSDNGKYLSYHEHFTGEAQESNRTVTYFVDVEMNSYVKNPGVKFLKKGELVVSNPLTEIGLPHQARFKMSPHEYARHDDYQLDLEEIPFSSQDCDSYYKETKILKLTLTNRENGMIQILQKDARMPKARGCPSAYRIHDVYIFNDQYIAVFLHKFVACVEGPCVGNMVITGKIGIASSNEP